MDPRQQVRARRLLLPLMIAMSALLMWVPWPLASNRPLFWLLLAVAVGGCAVLWIVRAMAAKEGALCYPLPWQRFRVPIVLYVLALLWCLFQALPLSDGLAHPLWGMAASALSNSALRPSLSLDPAQSVDQCLRFLTYGVTFWLALQLGRFREYAQMFSGVIVIVGSLVAAYGILMFVFDIQKVVWEDKYYYQDVVTASFVGRNAYAVYAGIGVIVALSRMVQALFLHTDSLRGKALYRVCLHNGVTRAVWWLLAASVMLAALLLTRSRAGIVASLLGMTVFFLLVLSARMRRSRMRSLWFLCVPVCGVLSFLFVESGGYVWDRLWFDSVALELRPEIYRVTWDGIFNNLWQGTGAGTFEAAFRLYHDSIFPFVLARIDHAHNSFLETALELGVPATLMLGIAVVWCVCYALVGVWKRRRDFEFPAVAVAVSVVVWAHALVDFGIEMPAVAFTYALLLGVGCAQARSSREDATRQEILEPLSRAASVGVMVLPLFLIWVGGVGVVHAVQRWPLERLALRLDLHRDVSEEMLRDVVVSSAARDISDASFLALRSESQVLLARYRGVFTPEGLELLSHAERDVQRALSLSVAQPYAWLELAYIRFLRGADISTVLSALELSFFTGPNFSSLLEARTRFALLLWSESGEELRGQILSNVVLLSQQKPQLIQEWMELEQGCEVLRAAQIPADRCARIQD